MINKIKEKFNFLENYLVHLSTIIFVTGFISDFFLLPDINNFYSRLIGGIYIFIISVLFVLYNLYWVKNNFKLYIGINFLLAFFSGSALSFVLVYLIRASSFLASYPLLITFVLFLILNELIKSYEKRKYLNFFVIILAFNFYILFNLPFWIDYQNDYVFILSLIFSLIVSFLYIKIIYFFTKQNTLFYYLISFLISIFILIFYFLNSLPAIPLSSLNNNIYNYISKIDNYYYAYGSQKEKSFFDIFKKDVFYIKKDFNSIYFFHSLKAPSNLKAPITHIWEYKKDNKWIEINKISFNILGGRADGYRAYSYLKNAFPGEFRIKILLGKKRIIKIYNFKLEIKDNFEIVEKIL